VYLVCHRVSIESPQPVPGWLIHAPCWSLENIIILFRYPNENNPTTYHPQKPGDIQYPSHSHAPFFLSFEILLVFFPFPFPHEINTFLGAPPPRSSYCLTKAILAFLFLDLLFSHPSDHPPWEWFLFFPSLLLLALSDFLNLRVPSID